MFKNISVNKLRKIFFVLTVFILFQSVFLSHSAFSCSAPEKDKERKENKRTSLVVIPVVLYSPETRWGLGGGGLFSFRPRKNQELARPSSLMFVAYYTQNSQYSIELKPEIYLKGEDYLLTGELIIRRYPQNFYGIDSGTPESLEENYTPKKFMMDASAQKKIFASANIYAGLRFRFESYRILKTEPGRLLDSGTIPGGSGANLSGLGFVVNWDTRDNVFFPTAGNYIRLTSTFYSSFLGSEFDFSYIKMDIRKYISLFRKHVLALQAVCQTVPGNPPFPYLSQLGGDTIMRGYYRGRYRDKNLIAAQAEYRLPIWKRWGMVLFAGLGEVGDRFGSMSLSDFKCSYGIGLRYTVVPREGTNLRVDFGYGKNTKGTYISANEAF